MLSHHFTATFCCELSSVLMSILDWTNLLLRWNDSLIWDVGTERVHASKTSRCYQRRQLMIPVTETSVPQRFSVSTLSLAATFATVSLGRLRLMTLYAGIGALVCVIWWLLSALVTARVLRTDPSRHSKPRAITVRSQLLLLQPSYTWSSTRQRASCSWKEWNDPEERLAGRRSVVV